MPATPDRFPGVRKDEGVDLEPTSTATSEGQIRYVNGRFSMFDQNGEYDPSTGGGGGISEPQHEDLDTLTHDLTETHNLVITRDGNSRVQTVLAEEVGGTDIRKMEILTRTGGKVATFRETHYAADGVTIKRQLDVTVNRTSGKVTSMNVVRTV